MADISVHFILLVSIYYQFLYIHYKVGIYILFYPFVVYNLYISDSLLKNYIQKNDEKKESIKESVSIFELLLIRRFTFGALSQMFIMMSVQYLNPILAITLE